jgi:hypothetical protein
VAILQPRSLKNTAASSPSASIVSNNKPNLREVTVELHREHSARLALF